MLWRHVVTHSQSSLQIVNYGIYMVTVNALGAVFHMVLIGILARSFVHVQNEGRLSEKWNRYWCSLTLSEGSKGLPQQYGDEVPK